MEPRLSGVALADDDEVKVNALALWLDNCGAFGRVFYIASIWVYALSLPYMLIMLSVRAPWWLTTIVVIGNLGAILAHMSQLDALEGLLNRLIRRQRVSPADLVRSARASQD